MSPDKDYRAEKGARHKVALELVWTGDGRIFLNYWDHIGGDDVCLQVIDGTLTIEKDQRERFDGHTAMNLSQFIEEVKKRTEKS